MANQSTKYRKFLAGAASAALVASAVVPTALAAELTDIKGNTHEKAIKSLVDAGIIKGYPDGTFKPNQELTRNNVVKMLGKWLETLGKAVPADYKTVQRFDDVPLTADDELLKYAALVKDNGVFNGSNGKLLAADKISRENMALVLVRAFDAVNESDLVSYVNDQTFTKEVTDLATAKAEAQPFINVLDFFNITTATTFNPKGNVTRGQFSTFLNNLINTEAPVTTPEVVSVSAINAKQIEVKFNKAVDTATVINAADKALKGITVSGVSATYTAKLSEDKKILTITASTSLDGKDLIVDLPKETVKDEKGEFVTSHLVKLSVKDTVAPSILATEAVNASTVKVNFSEPMSSVPTPSFKYADGTTANVTFTLDASGEFGTLDLTNAVAKKDVTVGFIGAKDIAGNLISPNPSSVTVQKGDKDGVAPSVVSLDALAPNKTVIKFSEKVNGLEASDFTGLTVSDVKQDSTDKTKYVLTHTSVTGLNSVSLNASAVSDFSGEQNVVFTKILDYKADTVAPSLSSAVVSKDAKDGKEYLTLTFNKDVTVLGDITLAGTERKDGVSTDVTDVKISKASLTGVDGSTSVYKVALADVANVKSDASYVLTLPKEVVENISGVKNVAQTNAISFTRTTDSNTLAQSVKTITPSLTDNNVVTVEFNQAFDVASAENAANYTIDGAVVKQAINKDANKKVVTLILETGKTTFSGERNISISGVKTAAGVSMEKAHSDKVTLTENVAPSVVSAVLSVDLKTIVVTFSENLDALTAGDDLEVFKGTDTAALVEDAVAVEKIVDNKLTITLKDPVTTLDLKVKASSTLDLADTNKNLVVFPASVNVTSN
ncbi:S-layer homology domain-containing protein [Psychrobacillus sp. FSL H8-0483]|uniref:S-layer homology domain-containing protein n=1 Tax=Psychrobacillus sp. FSL H8-0483 TaxID=2921389 RepID=UPI00315A02E2